MQLLFMIFKEYTNIRDIELLQFQKNLLTDNFYMYLISECEFLLRYSHSCININLTIISVLNDIHVIDQLLKL